MDTASNITHFTSFLAREGYATAETTEHFVTFEARNRTFVIAMTQDDPHYFRLILPNFVTIDDNLDHGTVRAIASDVTAEVKVAKVFVVENKVWATIEMLIDSPEQTHTMFARMLELLCAAEDLFTSKFDTARDNEVADDNEAQVAV